MSCFVCPFCGQSMSVYKDTYFSKEVNFGDYYKQSSYGIDHFPFLIKVEFYKCPNCHEESIVVTGLGEKVDGVRRWIHPQSIAKVYPEYVPKQIRDDYEEAAAIVDLSPKASATLARRCLQGMIRDFWDVKGKNNLYQEIEEISEKVSPATKKALNDTRQIGNIGAHMEEDIDKIIDIDPGEAKTLLRLIEHLMKEWYISRYETERLLSEISQINEQKQLAKKDI